MNNFIKKIVGAIVGVLLLLLGAERHKNKKQKETIEEQKEQIAHEHKQADIFKVVSETVTKSIELEEPIEKQIEVEDQIEKTVEAEETIDIANGIIACFNRMPDTNRNSGNQNSRISN